MPRAGEAGRKLQAALEHRFGFAVTAQARAGLSQHPQRGDVGRLGADALAQQMLGDGEVVVTKRERGLDQHRVGGGASDQLGARAPGAILVALPPPADRQVLATDRAVGLQDQGAATGRNRAARVADGRAGRGQLDVHLGRIRLLRR